MSSSNSPNRDSRLVNRLNISASPITQVSLLRMWLNSCASTATISRLLNTRSSASVIAMAD